MKLRPVLKIYDDSIKNKYSLIPVITIGLVKAKALIEKKEDIIDFIKKYDKKSH